MSSTLEKVAGGLGDMIDGVLKAVQQLPARQTQLWITQWKEITARIIELGLDTEGKKVGEVLQHIQEIQPAYAVVASVLLRLEGYLAENTTSGVDFRLDVGFKGITATGGYSRSNERREAGNAGVEIDAFFNETPCALPSNVIQDLTWASFIEKLDTFDFLTKTV